jgi:hypothetical protein
VSGVLRHEQSERCEKMSCKRYLAIDVSNSGLDASHVSHPNEVDHGASSVPRSFVARAWVPSSRSSAFSLPDFD